MIRFPDQKLILVTPAKCASSAVTGYITEHYNVCVLSPPPTARLTDKHQSSANSLYVPDEFADHDVAMILRNPFDRLVSLWFWWLDAHRDLPQASGIRFHEWVRIFVLTQCRLWGVGGDTPKNPETGMDQLPPWPWATRREPWYFQPISKVYRINETERRPFARLYPNRILTYEFLDQELEDLLTHYNICPKHEKKPRKNIVLPPENVTTAKRNYAGYYDFQLAREVREGFDSDFELLQTSQIYDT